MKAYLEIVSLENDIVTTSDSSTAGNTCPCFDAFTPGSEDCTTDE